MYVLRTKYFTRSFLSNLCNKDSIIRLILQRLKITDIVCLFFPFPSSSETLFSFSLPFSLCQIVDCPIGGLSPGLGKKAVRVREAWETPSSLHFHSGCERNDMHFLLSECHEIFWLVLALTLHMCSLLCSLPWKKKRSCLWSFFCYCIYPVNEYS